MQINKIDIAYDGTGVREHTNRDCHVHCQGCRAGGGYRAVRIGIRQVPPVPAA